MVAIIAEPTFSPSDCLTRAHELGHKTISDFQRFYGLEPDGDPGPKTQRLLHGRRICGCPDRVRGPEGALCKWPEMPEVATWHDMDFSGLAVRAWKSAISAWNKVCGINLTVAARKELANIYAHARRIDGGGGTLAWSYLPCGATPNTRLEQRYDTGEAWTFAFLRRVILHEIGHAIGFEHSPNPRSIMYAFSNGVDDLHIEDVEGAQERYGLPGPSEPPDDPGEPDSPVDGDWDFDGGIIVTHRPSGDRIRVTLFERL